MFVLTPEARSELRFSYLDVFSDRDLLRSQRDHSRGILRNVRIVPIGLRIGEVVAAAFADGRQIPILFDELKNRNVVGIVVRDRARFHEW